MKYNRIKPHKMETVKMGNEHMPSISFNLKDLPEAKDWEIGEIYEVSLKIKQTGISMHGEKEGYADFEIQGIAINGEDDE